jgi:hypothetical protein
VGIKAHGWLTSTTTCDNLRARVLLVLLFSMTPALLCVGCVPATGSMVLGSALGPCASAASRGVNVDVVANPMIAVHCTPNSRPACGVPLAPPITYDKRRARAVAALLASADEGRMSSLMLLRASAGAVDPFNAGAAAAGATTAAVGGASTAVWQAMRLCATIKQRFNSKMLSMGAQPRSHLEVSQQAATAVEPVCLPHPEAERWRSPTASGREAKHVGVAQYLKPHNHAACTSRAHHAGLKL